MLFFVSSTLLSKFHARAKAEVNEKFQKGSQRDVGQVLANGGWAALLAIGYWYAQQTNAGDRTVTLFFVALVGALATVTADTWATEIGVLSQDLPRLLTTGRAVPAGTSGGITALGTVVAFTGALLIGALGSLRQFHLIYPEVLGGVPSLDLQATFLLWLPFVSFFAFLGGIGGLAGALFDSFLGATVQAMYFAEYDERQTERETDSQGKPTRLIRGWRWLDNDWVNFLRPCLAVWSLPSSLFLFL